MRWLGALLLLIAGCGDPLASGDFVGDAKLKLQAIVCGEQHAIVPQNPRLGILWKTHESEKGWVLNEVTPVGSDEFPQVVDLRLFDAPPSGAELGCPILFDDLDDDETFTETDAILAVSWNHLIGFSRNSYQLLEGICAEDGYPSGKLIPTNRNVIDVNFLEAPDRFPERNPPGACVDFF